MQIAGWVENNFRKFKVLVVIFIISACATSGPVTTVQEDSRYEIVSAPKEFVSPLDQIENAREHALDSEIKIKGQKRYTDQEWLKYASWAQAWDELEYEQSQLEQELEKTGEVEIFPGRSYSFNLESYCVYGGQARPVTGDELKAALLRGPAEKWLPKILTEQGKFGIPQERVQYLIWALLYDARFDELSSEDQQTLLRFYPDAAVRFGNRRLEEFGKDIIHEIFPSEITNVADQIVEYRERILELGDDYHELEQVLAPRFDRRKPIPVGWMKIPDGYLVRLTADSYTRVRLDIYVPVEGSFSRAPQSIKKIRPSQWIGLPAKGQRVAISSRAITRKKRDSETACDMLKKWHPKSCRPMSDEDRKRIMDAADTKNFPNTQYKFPPNPGTKPEEETDCSHFVNEIFRREGFEYKYSPTENLRCLDIFQFLPLKDYFPGDLVLWKDHVGIIDKDGSVISATKGGPKKISTLPVNDPRFSPAIRRLTLKDFKDKPSPLGILRWRCP